MITTQTAQGANQLSQDAYNNDQQLQHMYDTQSQQAQGQYGQAQQGAQNAQADLQNYTHQIAGQNYGDIYGQRLGQAQQMYGFNPTDLLKANQNLATTQTTLANLPQAIQQQGNYYGTTAGAEANNYAGMAGNLNTVLAGQGNAVNAYNSVLNATQNQAQQQTGQQLEGQKAALSGYQASAQNATSIMQNSGNVMAQIEKLQQDQGYATAEQIKAYQDAYSQYVNAQAAAQQAQAATIAANGSAAQAYAQAGLANQQTANAKAALNTQSHSSQAPPAASPAPSQFGHIVSSAMNTPSSLAHAGMALEGLFNPLTSTAAGIQALRGR